MAGATLADLRPVYVVGIGLHPYQRPSTTPYVALGVRAVRDALADAAIRWPDVEAAYTGSATTAMGVSRPMYRHLGGTGIPMTQVENGSASGSTAFRQAARDVAAGLHDVVLAAGVDKPLSASYADRPAGYRDLVSAMMTPATHFALLADHYMTTYGVTVAQVAAVAVKNSRNAALNPFAQRRRARTLEEVLAPPLISGPFTRLQCCPVGEGAAAAVVASADAVARLGIDRSRLVRVRAASLRSQAQAAHRTHHHDAEVTAAAAAAAFEEAGLGPDELDVVEAHDAFTIEELLYVEAMGLCEPGEAAYRLAKGEFDIGGRVAVGPSGGLLGMGHPMGPTGVGQVCEAVRQVRGEAGDRQHPGARTALTHMVGAGTVSTVTVLSR